MERLPSQRVYSLLPEQAVPLACQACGCCTVFATAEPLSQRVAPFFLRCCQCGQERRDLAALDYGVPSA